MSDTTPGRAESSRKQHGAPPPPHPGEAPLARAKTIGPASILVKTLFSVTGPRTLLEFRNQCREPRRTQEKLLAKILRMNATTEYGRQYKFSSIKNGADFQKRIPLNRYRDLFPFIQRSLEGEPNQLTSEQPTLFSTTSGTTGKSKYIPVTPSSRKSKSALMRVWLSALFRDHPDVFNGKVLTVVSPEEESLSRGGIPCGAESGHGYKNMPGAIRAMYSCPYEVCLIKDYDARYYALLRVAAVQPIRVIYTCNPSTVLLLARLLGQHSQELIKDIREGTLSGRFDIANEWRRVLKDYLAPNPAWARQLKQLAAGNEGRLLPRMVWPDMSLIGCWKGGTVGLYLKDFDRYYPRGLPVRDIGYFASEHRGSVPLSDEGDAGAIAVPTNFYEFYPANAGKKPGPEDLMTVSDLEEGKRYCVYVTTNAGLYRYGMNDIVEVTGYYDMTPMIRFVQKGKGIVSFTGEKLSENQVITAAGAVLDKHPGRGEFVAAIGQKVKDNINYVFVVETDAAIGREEGHALASALEEAVREQNMEYTVKRDSQRLDPIVLRCVARGSLDRYRAKMNEAGNRDGQFKILRLSTDASFLEEFKPLAEFAAD